MGFRRLEENLIDLVKEQQAKLGFRPEVIRLYYPVSTLNHFFGSEDTAALPKDHITEKQLEEREKSA